MTRSTTAFLHALPPDLREALAPSTEWRARFTAATARAAELVGTRFHPEAFGAFLAGRIAASDAPTLRELRLDQLALAYASLEGSPTATAALEREIRRQVEREARRVRAEAHADDAAQLVRELLLTHGPRRRPALTQYSGRGELGAFIRVIAVRELVRLGRHAASPRDEAVDAATLESLRVSGDDPELGFLRAHYRETFRQAFAAAMAELDERDRRLLRQHFVAQVSLDALAAAHAVHRATLARWLVKARAEVARRVREHLRRDAGISPSELDSLLRLAVSRLDISLRHLDTPRT